MPNLRRKYGTELLETNYPILFHRTHGWCHFVGNQMVEVTKHNRNTNNFKIAICDILTLLK